MANKMTNEANNGRVHPLVLRLRTCADNDERIGADDASALWREAADEIERMRVAVAFALDALLDADERASDDPLFWGVLADAKTELLTVTPNDAFKRDAPGGAASRGTEG